MSIVEMLVATGIGSVLVVVLASFIVFTARSFAALANYADLEYASRNALDRMTCDIRQTFGLYNSLSNELDFEDAPDHQVLKYVYDPRQQTLTRIKSGIYTRLLDHCTALRFDIYQRNTITGTYDQYPTATNPDQCKVVQVTWTCSRQLFGSALFNTEVVQTAKIVIRKK